MNHEITQILIALLLGIPSIILILTKCYKLSACCIFGSMILGLSALIDISISDGYAEEGIYFTFFLISRELKEGNHKLIINAIDETEMGSKTKDRYNLSERIRAARDAVENNEPNKTLHANP